MFIADVSVDLVCCTLFCWLWVCASWIGYCFKVGCLCLCGLVGFVVLFVFVSCFLMCLLARGVGCLIKVWIPCYIACLWLSFWFLVLGWH